MNDEFIKLILIGIAIIVTILISVLIYIYIKEKIQNKSEHKPIEVNNEAEEKKAQKSIFKFMEFDNIEDNMIVQDNGKKYLMVIECKGVNYDLLSNVEKTAIERGFLEFLNALKFEIQLYVQTRKVNLTPSTIEYRKRLKMIEEDMRNEEEKLQDMQRLGNYTKDEILKQIKEVTKKRNLYEYGRDVIENTEQMSEDSDLTRKEYYIVVPYYTNDIMLSGDYDNREISNMAFSELYTRARSIVNTLTECDVRGHILTSYELIELLYIAYNREQHDIYDFQEYINKSGFQSFYSVSEDVLDKRIRALDDEILSQASEKALQAFKIVSKRTAEKQRIIADREERMDEYIDATANKILDSEKNNIDADILKEAKEEVLKITAQKNKRKEQINKKHTGDKSKTQKAKKELTEEDKKRRMAILKKRKMLMEREAKKNEKTQS